MLLTAVGAARQEPPAGQVVLSAVRFYEAVSRVTQVKAFIEIPAAVLEPTEASPSGAMTYLMDVRVRDSTGLELVRNNWTGHVPATAHRSWATTIEILDFALAPGRYRIEVAVTDSASGRVYTSVLPIEGYRAEPNLSDLLLAPQIRTAASGDSLPGPGQIRRQGLLITATAELHLTPLRSKAFYLLETYNTDPDSVSLAVTVSNESGQSVVATPRRIVNLPKGGGLLTGAVDLAGLPAGTYRMTASVDLQGRRMERTAQFNMADLAGSVARDASLRREDLVTDRGYFASMSTEELDRAAAPLSLIAKPGEMSVYRKNLSLQAKRRFLSEFWSQRDPAPATRPNELRERFYAGIAYADSSFRERGRISEPGWKTDRGRIYVRHGNPDEVLRRQQQGFAPPYEVWRYNSGKGNYYIFADRSGVGGYKLMSTNDLREVGDPNWQRILGIPALQDIGNFLNLDQIELAPGS